MLGATALLGAALYGLAASSDDASVAGAYCAFTCGLLIWGWHEISFLMGFVTGPRRDALPRQAAAAGATSGHATADHPLPRAGDRWRRRSLMVALTWGGANQVGTWTFLVLWVMRLSAKLNVFLGVPNLTEEFLPEHLRYLKSFLARKPMNLLFPVSVTGSTDRRRPADRRTRLAAEAGAFEAAGFTFLGDADWRWPSSSTGSWCCRCRTRRCGAGACARGDAARQRRHDRADDPTRRARRA